MDANLSKRQFAKNLSANLLGFVLALVSGFLLTPFWIDHLGVAAYGLVPLTNNLVGFLAVITIVLSSSVSRFITVEVARGRLERANRIFNTSLWGSVVLALVAFVAGAFASRYADRLIAVPDGYQSDARLMFVLATATFAVSLLQTPFGAAMYCANRVDLNAWLTVLMRFVQIAVGVGLVATVYCRPGAMMIALLAAGAVSLAAAVVYWRRLMPWSRIGLSLDVGILKEQLTFGLWNAVNLVGTLLYLQIDLLVVNRLLGPEPGGRYAALSQWSLLLRGLGGTVSAVFGPSITHYHARGEVAEVVRYTRWSIRTLGLFLALPVGLICGLGEPMLVRWLGAEYAHLGPLLALMVFHLGVNVAVYPIFTVQAAANRVRMPAIVTCVMGAGNALLAVALTHALGMYGVALAGAVMLTAKNVIFSPLYAARILGCRWHEFFGDILKVLALSSAVTALAFGVTRLVTLTTWSRLAVAGVALGLIYVPVVWWAFLSREERAQLQANVLAPAKARVAGALR